MTFAWDGTSNATLSSPTPFFGKTWTAHHMNIYGPGTYVFWTNCPAGNPACNPTSYLTNYQLTVPDGYVGAHLLYNWSTSTNVDIVQLWKPNASWDASGGELGNGGTSPDPFCATPFTTGGCNTNPNPNGNTRYTVWDAVSVDTPASVIYYDGSYTGYHETEINTYHGTKMIDGPTTGQSFNFNVMGLTAPVPLPSTAWLLGSGVAGLLGTALRRKRNARLNGS